MVETTITMAVAQADSVTNVSVTVALLTIDPGKVTARDPTGEKPIEASGVITAKEAGRGAMVEMRVACEIEAGESEGAENVPGLGVGHHVAEEGENVIRTEGGDIVVAVVAVGAEVEVIAVAAAEA